MQSVQFGTRFQFKIGDGFEEKFKKNIFRGGYYHWNGNDGSTYLLLRASGEDVIIYTDTRPTDEAIRDVGLLKKGLAYLRERYVITGVQQTEIYNQGLEACFKRADRQGEQQARRNQNPFLDTDV